MSLYPCLPYLHFAFGVLYHFGHLLTLQHNSAIQEKRERRKSSNNKVPGLSIGELLPLQEHAALLHAWIKLELANVSPTAHHPTSPKTPNHHQPDLQQLSGHAKALQAAAPEAAMLQPLWLTISAAAAASEAASTAAGLRGLVTSWRAQADEDSAEFEAELVRLDAQLAFQTGQKLQVTNNMQSATYLQSDVC